MGAAFMASILFILWRIVSNKTHVNNSECTREFIRRCIFSSRLMHPLLYCCSEIASGYKLFKVYLNILCLAGFIFSTNPSTESMQLEERYIFRRFILNDYCKNENKWTMTLKFLLMLYCWIHLIALLCFWTFIEETFIYLI